MNNSFQPIYRSRLETYNQFISANLQVPARDLQSIYFSQFTGPGSRLTINLFQPIYRSRLETYNHFKFSYFTDYKHLQLTLNESNTLAPADPHNKFFNNLNLRGGGLGGGGKTVLYLIPTSGLCENLAVNDANL